METEVPMTYAISLKSAGRLARTFAEEVGSLLVGAVATLGLFLAIAHFKGAPEEKPAPEIAELRAMTMPPEPPPPKPVENLQPSETPVPFAGLAVSASDSPVKIAVVPPDFEHLVPTSQVPPIAAIQSTQLFKDLKPRMDLAADFSRVFQPSEVDQRVEVLSRPNPRWPKSIESSVRQLRVTYLVIVGVKGRADSVRLLKSCGHPDFDKHVATQIRSQWIFSPAMKNGRKVRCLVQQSVTVSMSNASPFGF